MNKCVKKFDVLIVGAGPAGLVAATCAAESGQRVGLVDDNPEPGGQIWRSQRAKAVASAARWVLRFKAAGGEVIAGARVFHQPQPGTLLAESLDQDLQLIYRQLVLATGARERFLPFPGWTLPNVMGAGGLQALVKSGLSIEGKRVVVAGSGPLLLAVAAYLKNNGANVLLVCEQASWLSLASFGSTLVFHPRKIVEGISFRKQLSGVTYAAATWPVRAEGDRRLASVTLSRNGRLETLACDYLACGFHLVPNTELGALLGCRLANDVIEVDDFQQTSVSEIYCAGEPTGVGGLEMAMVQGQIAGLAVCGRGMEARKLFRARAKLRHFAARMDRVFVPRSELRSLPQGETLVCRCEDVAFGKLKPHSSWRAAKLQTRCGMGPCQGRICGPATQFLFNWHPDSVRPPVFPARFSSIAASAASETPNAQSIRGGN